MPFVITALFGLLDDAPVHGAIVFDDEPSNFATAAEAFDRIAVWAREDPELFKGDMQHLTVEWRDDPVKEVKIIEVPDEKPLRCSRCGEEYKLGYGGATGALMERHGVCFSCAHWLEKLAVRDDPQTVRVGGRHYWIGPEDAGPSFRGFGGATYRIRFYDGREVTTTNLWCQGEIPKHFRDELPDNAEFLN